MNRKDYATQVLNELSKYNDETILLKFIEDLLKISNLKPYCDKVRNPNIKLEFKYKIKS